MEPGCDRRDHGRDLQEFGVRERSFHRAARMLHAAGDEARLRLLVRLSEGERCVTDLAAGSDERMSTVSQRLKVLKGEGLVTGRREGKHVYYTLADRHVYDVILSILAHADEQDSSGKDG
ncbi:putative transcriptional regulators [Rubrobacter radiotolerans]|uniref:Metalloregulator ArsR/SmtB family transcription factor n=1 Tax=Rubrobacter radiotolerans TaxID=42256 RepID=A0A023X1S5_RUBRA|nr:metalloregulator ArsR/SmtB family transcription factor [Rubrobacter radiotolerans]AHY46422.1 putative transcriptional regulators [Rubrobacter radiotolerans]MDX5893829.1 metalloregulator ArsR/SmtB family transcription factor [Rubrobacter radiotolerans]SMC04582.1 transcriptional regulator, ArsR family [Rubrobacter radiotolerans DSM 5868]